MRIGAFHVVNEMAFWKGARLQQQLLLQQRWCRCLCSSNAEVAVFWDLNKCGLENVTGKDDNGKASLAPSDVAPNIVKSLRSTGFSGAITIRAYGNTRAFSNHRLTEALLATGVDLHHVSGGSNYSSKHLILDLLLWVRETSPPAHMLLISGDKEFSSVLHRLHMRGYTVLLAHPEGGISRDLCTAASKVWSWAEMLKGTASTVSLHHDRLPQSDLPNNCAESSYLLNQEVQPKIDGNQDFICPETKRITTSIPQEVVEQILDIIRSRPSGFTLSALRRQLAKSNVSLDKNFYGQRDLLSFLMSIPNLRARLIWTSDKTRTFLFTENLNQEGHTNTDERDVVCRRLDDHKISKQKSAIPDGKEVVTTLPDVSNDGKQETIKTEQGKSNVGLMAPCSEQNDKSTNEGSRIQGNTKSSYDVDLPHDLQARKVLWFSSRGLSAVAAAWNNTLLKLNGFIRIWHFEFPQLFRSEKIYSKFASAKKGKKTQPENDVTNGIGSCIRSLSSSKFKEKNGDMTYEKMSVASMEGDKLKAFHESDGWEALQTEHFAGRNLHKKCTMVAGGDCFEMQQTRSGTDAGSKGQGRECELQSHIDVTSFFLDAGMNKRLTDQ